MVLEKPLGHDLASARRINDEVGQFFQERQIFRIDHYLGKETVQNLMVVSAASILTHPADPILTQGGLLNLDSATVDKCSQ